MTGWQCPACKTCYAPWVSSCPCKGQPVQMYHWGSTSKCFHASWHVTSAGRKCDLCGENLDVKTP